MGERTIVGVVNDLLFQSRLEQQGRQLGYDFIAVDSEAELRAALHRGCDLAIVDLHVQGVDWRNAVAMAKEASVPVLAFGRHTEAQLLRAARDAGCDRVVPRSQLVEELAALIEELAGKTSVSGPPGGSDSSLRSE